MALTTTTLASACAATDRSIVVASATSLVANMMVLIDQETMYIAKDYVSGTTANVLRGREGSVSAAHNTTANVVFGVSSDFASNLAQQPVLYPVGGRGCQLVSITATSTLTLPTPGNDLRVVLNGTGAITLTIPVPTKDMDGTEIGFVSNGAAAHLLTFTGGLSGAGSNYDVITINATAPAAFKVVACNALWMIYCGPALGGTVTNIIGSVA